MTKKYLIFNKKFLKIIFWLFLCFSFVNISFGDDIMYNLFEPSINQNSVIYIWKNKSDVWHSVLRKTVWIEYDHWFNTYTEAPLIVRITKLLLRLTVVLSVSMVMFNAVKYLIEVFDWKDWKSAASKKNLINVWVWLLVALLSVSAVNLVSSLWKSTITTSDDIDTFAWWCLIGSEMYQINNQFKEYLCYNAHLWYNDDLSNRERTAWFLGISGKCKIDNNEIRIDRGLAEIWCRELWWSYWD